MNDISINISKEEAYKELERRALEKSLLAYIKWAYKKKTGKEFIVTPHIIEFCKILEKVVAGEITRLIVNCPPRYSKTEVFVKSFIEWSIAKVNHAKFIHLSYSDSLALDNSASIRESIKSDWYQYHWPMKTKADSDAKQKWFTEFGGGVYATGIEGSITGFGAGQTEPGFAGAIIIDDPHKSGEAASDVQREKINGRLNDTILSRLNNPSETPIIIIMQRLHLDDMTGFCLNGGTGEKWEHISFPVLDEHERPLWPLKHSLEQLNVMRKANPIVFAGQYMQSPVAGTGNMFTAEMFEFGKVPHEYDYSYVTVDTSYKDKQKNDSTAMAAGVVVNKLLHIDQIYDKKIKAEIAENELLNFIRPYSKYGLRGVYIEEKGHGIYLNQALPKKSVLIPHEKDLKEFYKDRRFDKVERANNVLPYLSNRKIIINENLPNKEALLEQLLAFPNAKHDDMVDCVIDLIKLVYSREITTFDVL